MKILVNKDILIFVFYGYIRNIGKISVKYKLFKIHENA